MKKISLLLGILCFVYSGLYVLGYLPVSVWEYILDLFIDRDPNAYYKIVQSESAEIQLIASLMLGIVLIVYAKWPQEGKTEGD